MCLTELEDDLVYKVLKSCHFTYYQFHFLVFYPAFPPGAQGSVIALCPQFFPTTIVQGTLS